MSSRTSFEKEATRSLAPGPFVLTPEDFRRITAILHEDAGIWLSEAKVALVYSRLAKRLRALGMENFRDYCVLISSREGVDERQKMLAALTTNVTRFFRETHHFEHLKKVLEAKASEVRQGARLRIWSSACSDGQEPYSIAMTLLSVLPKAANLDVRVLATDIDPNMIAAGKIGVYDEDAVSAVPSAMRARWLTPVTTQSGRAWKVHETLAELVAFRELNLIGAWPMKGKFDAIFCRNVVIYFEEKTQHMIWNRFIPKLIPDGRLYIGHSERVTGPAARSFIGDGVTTYRLHGGA